MDRHEENSADTRIEKERDELLFGECLQPQERRGERRPNVLKRLPDHHVGAPISIQPLAGKHERERKEAERSGRQQGQVGQHDSLGLP